MTHATGGLPTRMRQDEARAIDSDPNYCWAYPYLGGGLIQKYLGGKMALAFCHTKLSTRDSIKRGFILRVRMEHQTLGIGNAGEIDNRWDWLNDDESLVLPQIVQCGDMPENVIPTLVSFCSFDNGSFEGRNPLFGFQFLDGVIKVGGLCTNGEIGRAIRYYAVARDDRSHHQVKAGPDRIDDRSDVAADQRVEGLLKIGDKKFLLGLLRIRLDDDLVRVALLPSLKSFFKDWDLGLGPLDWD